jgi:CRP-like cAMP-binding protein
MGDNALLLRLGLFADLDDEDRAELTQLCRNVRAIPAKRDIESDGDRPEQVHLITQGWAARYKLLPDGSRQIMAFLIPGDFCDLHVAVLGRMDHGIVALTPCNVAFIDSAEMDALMSKNNRLTRAMWWGTLVDEAVLRQWVVNVGRRDAYARIAHVLCELHARMQLVDLVTEDQLALPLTQDELADATGLTPVHVNRTLQRLRADNLIEIGSGRLNVLDIGRLKEAGGFDASYLHIQRRVH